MNRFQSFANAKRFDAFAQINDGASWFGVWFLFFISLCQLTQMLRHGAHGIM